jgi:TonB family protein
MFRTRRVVPSLFCLIMLAGAQVTLGSWRVGVITQQSPAANAAAVDDVKRAIELYQRGDDKSVIQLLRPVLKEHKSIVTAWHYLGLAYERQGKSKDARKAHEQAAKAGEMMLDRLFSSLASRADIDVGQFQPVLSLAAESADKYLKLSPKPSSSKFQEWSLRSEYLRDYAEMSGNIPYNNLLGKVYKPSEVTTKARILKRTEPSYTEEARQNLVAGTVVLRAVIAADGQVRGIRVVSGLPYGLNLRAIDAARKIKFAPALLNGQPVSQYIQIEYNFNLY